MPVTKVKSQWKEGNLHFSGDGSIVIENNLVIAVGGSIENEGDLFTAFDVDESTLIVDDDTMSLGPAGARTQRFRVSTSDVNAGATLLPAIDGYKYRLVDVIAIAVGGNAGAVTTVDILGTQATSEVKLAAFAQASLTRSTVLRPGVSGTAVLADGASFAPCDDDTAITIGKTGDAMTTATHIDVILTYAVEEA